MIAKLVLVAITVATVATAAAQPEANVAEARRLFDQAEAYFRAGAFAEAAAAYQAAYDAAPRPVLVFNAALAWEKHGDIAAAVAAYDRYLAADPDGVKAVEARARRAALVPDLEKQRETKERTDRAAALRRQAEAQLQAGQHAEAIESLRVAHELVPDPEDDFAIGNAYLAAGDPVRAESAYRRYLESEGAHRDDAAARVREIEKAREEATAPPPPEPASMVPAIAAFSAGGVALAVGLGFGLHAGSLADELSGELEAGMPPITTADPRFDDGKRAALIANISYGVAGVAVVAGGFFLYRALRSRRAVDTSRVTIGPVASATSRGLAVEVTW